MFSTLSPGNIIYILDTKNNYNVLTGQVTKITPPRPKNNATMYTNYLYGQGADMVVDISATVNGEYREFKQVPSNAVVADFGSDAFVIADSKDAIVGHLNVTYNNSKAIVDGRDKNLQIMENCKKALASINPSVVLESQRDSAITNLQGQVNSLTEQVQQLVSALNKGNTKT